MQGTGKEGNTSLLSLREKASCGAVQKVRYLRLFKNIRMRGLRRLQERGVLQCTPQGRESSIRKQMGIFQQPAGPLVSPRTPQHRKASAKQQIGVLQRPDAGSILDGRQGGEYVLPQS